MGCNCHGWIRVKKHHDLKWLLKQVMLGKKQISIANECGVSESSMSKYINKYIKRRRGYSIKSNKRHYNLKWLVKKLSLGYTEKLIAEECRISQPAISMYIRKYLKKDPSEVKDIWVPI